MKKKLCSILLALTMVLTLLPVSALAEEGAPAEAQPENVAQIGDQKYATLAEAVAAAESGATVTLLKDASGCGIIVPEGKQFTLDFGGHTYTVDQSPLAGSSGTQSQCFQLLKNSTLTFKNGTIACNNSGVAMMIQNYADLTLVGMTINGDTMTRTGTYAMSNNCGNVVIKDTIINAKDGDAAFDVYGGFGSYSDVTVTIEGNSVINGRIEVARDNTSNKNRNTLMIKGGTINGPLAVTENANTTVSISGGAFTDLANAVKYATDGATIKLAGDVELDTRISITKKITLDLAGHTIKNGSDVKAQSGLFVVDNDGDFTINDSSAEKTGMIDAAAHDSNLWAAVVVWPDAGKTAKLTVNGGTLKGYYYPITGNGTCTDENCTTITINGGKLESVDGLAIYHPQNGQLTVNGGELIGQETAIEMRAGVLTINDGTFTATNKPTATQPNGSGTTTDGAAIAVCQHTTKLRTEVTINGGTFNGFSAFYEHNAQKNSAEDLTKVKLNITGGNFKTINDGTVSVYSQDKTGFISGGTYTSDPTAYVASGAIARKDGDAQYTVVAKSNLTSGVYTTSPEGALAAGYVYYQNSDKTYTVYYPVPVIPNNNNNSSSTTTKNPDGSTTTTTTDKATGAVTETTTTANGSVGTVKTDANGSTEISASISAADVKAAEQKNAPVIAPITVTPAASSAAAPIIKLSVPANAGEVAVAIPVVNAKQGTVAVRVNPDGTEEIIKTAVITENGLVLGVKGSMQIKVINNSKNFADTVGHWAASDVDFVSARELFNGTAPALFSPEASMTRGMVVTVIARLAGENTDGGANWYDKGCAWAVANGVSDGTDPNGSITREQLAAMLYRYCGSPAASGSLSAYADAASVSAFGSDAMQWCVNNGIINGMDGLLNPQGQATRAQVSAMFARYIRLAAAK